MTPRDLVEREREIAALAELLDAAPAGEGRVASIEGPAGIGKSRLLAEARRLAAAGGAQVLARARIRARARVPVRRGAPAVRGVLARARRARARRRRRARRGGLRGASRRARATPRSRRCTACTGSRSTSPPSGPLLLAIDDLHWCDRPSLRFLAYLARRLEGLPILVAATPAHRRARDRRRAARRDRPRPADGRRPPGPLSAAAVAGARRASGSARTPTTAFCRGVPPGHRRQPAAPAPAAAPRWRPTTCAPTPRTPTSCARSARGPSRAPCSCGSRGCRPTRSRSRAPSPCSASSADLPGRRRAHRRSTSSGRPTPPARWRVPRSCAARRRSGSSTRSSATPSTTSCRRRARAAARARPPVLRDARRAGRAGRRAPAHRAAARPAAGSRSCCARRPAAVARGRPGERRRLSAPRARGAAARTAAPELLRELGLAEALTDGPPRPSTSARPTRRSRIPWRARGRARAVPRVAVHRVRRPSVQRARARAADELPPELDDDRSSSRRSGQRRVLRRRCPESLEARGGTTARRPRTPGSARRCSPRRRRCGAHRPAAAEECVELALRGARAAT